MTTKKNEEIHTENKRFLQTLQEKIFNMGSGYEIDDENQNPPGISPKKEKEKEEEKVKEEKVKEEEKIEEKKVEEEVEKKEEKVGEEEKEEEEKEEKEEEEKEEEEEKKEEEKVEEEEEKKEEKEEKKEEEEDEEKKIYEEKINDEKIYDEKINNNNFDYSPVESPKNINLKESIPLPLEFNKIQNQDIQLEKEKEKENINSEDENNEIIDQNEIQHLPPINLAICKKHGKYFLKINPTNFEIVCKKCIEQGYISQLKIINNFNNKNNINDSEDEDEEKIKFNCFEHKNEKGSFYCEDCKQFVCNMCFADIHRQHKSHLPKIIANEFINIINEEIDNVNKLGPVLDDSINDIKKIYDNLKSQKADTMKIPQNTLKVIGSTNDNQIELFKKRANDKFMGIDKDVNDDCFTYNGIKEKNKKYLEILKNISEKLDSKSNKYILCIYHKRRTKILNEIKNYINSSFNFINVRLNNTNLKYVQNKEKIENSLNLINKEISNYEKSCISSISTGRENRAISLLRYVRFMHREIKYFKNSLIGFASNDNVFLTGLILCGLYIKINKNKNDNINTNNGEDLNNNEDINNNNEDLNASQKTKIPIQITILTMVNQAEGEKLYSQKYELYGVKGLDDHCVVFNFEKGIKIKKEKLYIIKVENLSETNYTDLWMGCIGKNNRKMQVIRCHNSGIQFLFKQTEGLQTDFDEFDHGIIAGVLYSTSK